MNNEREIVQSTHAYILTIHRIDIGKETKKICQCGKKLIYWHEFGMAILYRQIEKCVYDPSLSLSHTHNVLRKESHCTPTVMKVATKNMSPFNN